MAGNRFAEGKATKLSSTWAGSHEEVLKIPFLRTVVVILGHRLVEEGHSVLFAPAYRLVQELLAAKRDLALPRQLRKLDNFDFLLLDILEVRG